MKWVLSPAGIGIVAGFPLFYILFSLAIAILERKKADPLSGRAKTAGKRLTHAVSSATRTDDPVEAMTAIIAAFRNYLGDKFRVPSGALTVVEVEARLRKKGATDEIISEIKTLFADCEAARYGGHADAAKREQAVTTAKTLAKKLEKIL